MCVATDWTAGGGGNVGGCAGNWWKRGRELEERPGKEGKGVEEGSGKEGTSGLTFGEDGMICGESCWDTDAP